MGAHVLDRLRQDLGYAVRGVARSPGFTALAVLTLALGVGANAAVFSVLDRMFGQPPAGVSEPEGLRRLYVHLPENSFNPVFPFFNYAAFSAIDEAVSGAVEVAAWTSSSESTIHEGRRELTVRTSYVTHDYFSVLGVDAARGRLFGPEEAGVEVPAPVAVISHALWERAFARDAEVLGRTLELDSASFTVIGVAAEGFAGLDLSYTDVFFPLSTFPAQGQMGFAWYEWIGNYFHAVARLPGGGDDRLLAEMATAGYHRQEGPEPYFNIDTTATVLTGSVIAARGPGRRAGSTHQRQAVSVSVRTGGVSVILLLIACANVAGLLLVRATRRRREIAVRLALGVSRARLLSQLITEGMVLASLAAAAAVLLAAWGGAVLRRMLLPDVHWAGPALDARTVVFALGSAALVGLVAALAPALQSRRVDVSAGLKSGGRESGSPRSLLRSGLLAGQAALSIVLLVGAGLFVRSLGNVAALRLGFDVEELAWINPGRFVDAEEEPAGLRTHVASRLAELPGVSGAALARVPPMLGNAFTKVFLPGGDSLPLPPESYPGYNTVSPGFFAVTGMRILEGRGFDDGEEDGVVVVSETMARTLWPGESALGQCLRLGDPDGPCSEVIGVVEDSRRRQVIEEPTLQYFRPRRADAAGGMILLRVDPPRWSSVAQAARAELLPRFEERSVRMGRMTEALEPQLRPWRLGAQLFTAFGALALVVTVVGVYSVMAYAVSQRTHEMGVRMALGAKLRDVLRLVVGEGVRVVALGAALGVAAALALGRLVESLLYGVTPRDPWAMAVAAAALLATGALASLVPAWRAGRVDPSQVLRQE